MESIKERIYKAFNNKDSYSYAEIDALRDNFQTLLLSNEKGKLLGLKSYEESFSVKLTYNSNKIEGSTLTIGDTAEVLEGKTNLDKPLRDIFAARGVADGMEYAKKLVMSRTSLNEEIIKNMHEKTALDIEPETRGTYRTTVVFIKGSQTVPPQALKARGYLSDLVFAYQNTTTHPLTAAILFHSFFEEIHPFQDGNGRTGRNLLNYMLMKEKYAPIAIRYDSKNEYINALEKCQIENDFKPFVNLVKNAIETELLTRIDIIEQDLAIGN